MTLISGRVLDHTGTGVAGVYVSAQQAERRRFSVAPSVYTDLTGRWSLELPPGQWRVRETGYGSYDLTVGARDIDLTGPATAEPVDTTAEDVRAFLARRRSRES